MPRKSKIDASRLLTAKKFWSIVEESLDGTDSVGLTWKRQYTKLLQLLEPLSDRELFGFLNQQSKFFWRAHRQELWAVGHVVMGGMFSDDSFMDFKTWLIYRGETVYKAALRDHESLVEEFGKIPDGEIPIYEQYPVLDVFDKRHGEDAFYASRDRYKLYSPSKREQKISFTWKDLDSLRELCPRTFDAYWEDSPFC